MGPELTALRQALGHFVETRTRRGRNNVHYRHRALLLLGRDPEFSWLCDIEKMRQGVAVKTWRPTILIALGRIDDDDSLRAVAREICEQKPRSHDAVAMIRRYRLGGSRPGDADDLCREIIATIDGYLQRHPDTEWSDVIRALVEARSRVEDSAT